MFTISPGFRLSFLTLAGSLFVLAACQREAAPPAQAQAPEVAQAPAPPAATGRRLLPVDDAPKDASLLKFRQDLLQAVDRHDAAFVVAALDPHIRNSFGGDGGIEEFKTMWHPERADSKFWSELRAVLTHGGVLKAGSFCAPYVFSTFPDDLDSFDFAAVLADDVILRSKPEVNASGEVTLSYHIVKVDGEGADRTPAEWIKVATTEGKEGYVPAAVVRSPLDYRACFTRQSGAWKMNLFVAGD